MVSLKLSLSRSTSSSEIHNEEWEELPRPSSPAGSTAQDSITSSGSSILNSDTEDATVKVKQLLNNGMHKQRSLDDLRLLAISTNITELSYSISDIQTRIFEIQELRHQSQSIQDPQSSSNVIDQALISLDEKLEAVSRGMKTVADALESLASQTPTQSEEDADERVILLRKHKALVSDWEAVQDEGEILREELKEDKWLTVFRTVSEQADGMMTSLEKAIQRCQDFIWRVQRRLPSEEATLLAQSSPNSRDGTNSPLTYETFCALLDSFEAKKKHYMPATSKVLSIIDKGVQDRVTKNGECLRRHAEATQRWRNLGERIQRTEKEMEMIGKILLLQEGELDEFGSVSERTSRSSLSRGNGNLATPPSSEVSRRVGSSLESLSSSISPFRKFAKRLGGKVSGRSTPTSRKKSENNPSSDPMPSIKNRQSMFPLRGSDMLTPDRPTHKHAHSLTPESPMAYHSSVSPDDTVKFKPPKWNSSTKIVSEARQGLSKRPSNANMRSVSASHASVTPNYARSQSRSSFASSRPWSPITASGGSTTRSSVSRPQSRAQSPFGFMTNPRSRPKTPSQIPTPAFWKGSSTSSDVSYDDRSPPNSSIMQRLSPSHSNSSASGISSYSRAKTPLGTHIPYARPPSRSKIPVPKFQISSASRPSSAMSDYDRPESSMSFRSSAYRAQTPESALRGRSQNYTNDLINTPLSNRRGASRAPPSSFRRESSAAPRTPSSRPGSRAGAFTPSFELSIQKYFPVSTRDPLDMLVAEVANEIEHGLVIERLDPPLKTIPKENEEIKAQYAFSNHLSRKVVTCRLLTMSRSGGVKQQKVMCRVGGGWQDLRDYIVSRQSGF